MLSEMEQGCDPSEETTDKLTTLIRLSLQDDIRHSCTERQIEILKSVAQTIITECQQSSTNDHVYNNLINVIKLLRNICAGVPSNQIAVGEQVFLKDVVNFIGHEIENREIKGTQLVKVCIQLLGNTCVNNDVIQAMIWRLCYHDCFRILTQDDDSNVVNLSCMVIYTCIRNNTERSCQFTSQQSELIPQGGEGGLIISNILKSLKAAENSEWMLLLMEHILNTCPLQQLLETLLSPYNQVILLRLLLSYSESADFSSSLEDNSNTFSKVLSSNSNLIYLQQKYFKSVHNILNEDMLSILRASDDKTVEEERITETKTPDIVNLEILMAILNILCQCSSEIIYLKEMQKETELIKSSIDLLRQLSVSDGSISSARHRTQLPQVGVDQHTSIVFGLKRDIVRLIGNLCFKYKPNQDFISDDIPLLLNQCSIDHNNPCILSLVFNYQGIRLNCRVVLFILCFSAITFIIWYGGHLFIYHTCQATRNIPNGH